MSRCIECGKLKREHILLCPDEMECKIRELKATYRRGENLALAARALVERIRELEGDVPDSALLTGAYGPELGRLVGALKAYEEANRDV